MIDRRAYAARTKVPISQSKHDIEKELDRYGAEKFGYMVDADAFTLAFQADGRHIRINVPTDGLTDQQERAIWRASLLVIKSKLESIAAGIETFDEAFLAHIVTKTGHTVAESLAPQLASRAGPLLLAAPESSAPSPSASAAR